MTELQQFIKEMLELFTTYPDGNLFSNGVDIEALSGLESDSLRYAVAVRASV